MSFDYNLAAIARTYDDERFDRDHAEFPMWWNLGGSPQPEWARAELLAELEYRERLSRSEWRAGLLAQRIDRLPELDDTARALLRTAIKPKSARARMMLLAWVRGERWAEACADYVPQSNPFREALQVALDRVMERGFAIVHATAKEQGPGLFLCHNRIAAAVPRWGCPWCNEKGEYEVSPDPCPKCGGSGWIGAPLSEDQRIAIMHKRYAAARRVLYSAVDSAAVSDSVAAAVDMGSGPSRAAVVVRSVDGTIGRVRVDPPWD